MVISIIILVVIMVPVLFWSGLFFMMNDFSVKTRKKDELKFKRVVAIFPHPDDEVMSTGGFLKQLSDQNIGTYLIILTKGEKGVNNGDYTGDLRTVRSQEAIYAAKQYGVSRLFHLDLGDGQLSNKNDKISFEIEKILSDIKPDLVITFDKSGVYGHPDHMATSEAVTEVVKRGFLNTKLWYVSFPHKNVKKMKLPVHMAKDENFSEKRSFPTHRIYVGSSVFTKIEAFYGYKSQFMSFRRSAPLKFIPAWFFISFGLFEYYSEVQ